MVRKTIFATTMSAVFCILTSDGNAAAMPVTTARTLAVSSDQSPLGDIILVRARGAAAAGRSTVAHGHRGAGAQRTTVAHGHRGGGVHRHTAVNGRHGVAARHAVVVRPVRPWVRRPYYGRIVAGVALGTVIVAATVAVVPVAPAPDLCWYWADAAQIQGYWDYCH
jgi:hypothetical protein